MTDNKGEATFFTIYPGWYTGRATHIHVKVHINGTYVDESGVYTGGYVSHTGKINNSKFREFLDKQANLYFT